MKHKHLPAIIWLAAIVIPILLKMTGLITFRWMIVLIPLFLWLMLNLAYNVSVWIQRRNFQKGLSDEEEEEAWQKLQEKIRNHETEY